MFTKMCCLEITSLYSVQYINLMTCDGKVMALEITKISKVYLFEVYVSLL